MASPAEIREAMANWLPEFKAWASALFGREEWPRSLELEAFEIVSERCKRYGIDGMGDKPAEMSTTLYWLQHVPESCHFYGRLRLHAKEPERPLTEPKPKRARKGSGAAAAGGMAAAPEPAVPRAKRKSKRMLQEERALQMWGMGPHGAASYEPGFECLPLPEPAPPQP
jgi:hypothetical protein